MKKILVVEDNPRFQLAARKFFWTRLAVEYANDFVGAMDKLGELSHGTDGYGVIADILFPWRTGSHDIRLGLATLDKMSRSDPYENRARALMAELRKYGVALDPEMNSLVRVWAKWSSLDQCNKDIEGLRKVHAGGCDTTIYAKELLFRKYGRLRATEDCYGILEAAMKEDEHNQPLCIPLGERAHKLRVPFVIATSTSYSNPKTRPVFDYVKRIAESENAPNWTLVSCGRSYEGVKKGKPEFWKVTYDALRGKIRPHRQPANIRIGICGIE